MTNDYEKEASSKYGDERVFRHTRPECERRPLSHRRVVAGMEARDGRLYEEVGEGRFGVKTLVKTNKVNA